MRRLSSSSFRAAVVCTLLGGAALLPPASASAQPVITAGGVNGRLEQTDVTAGGRAFDEYRYQGERNERLTITLRATAFDPLLALLGPGNAGVVRQNDDDGRNPNSRIEVTLPARGTYVIRATSSQSSPRDTGEYSLSVSTDRRQPGDDGVVSPPPPPPPPLPESIRSAGDIAGAWTYAQTVGELGTPYFCDNYGFMFIEGTGPTFGVRFEQKGQCTTGGRTVSSAGAFSAADVPLVQEGLSGKSIRFTIESCVYTGEMVSYGSFDGTLQCRVRMPDGTEAPMTGVWSAVRQ
jgi:hypothetical protein